MLEKLLTTTALCALSAALAAADVSPEAHQAEVAVRVQRGDILHARGNCTLAIGEYREALKLAPTDASLHNKLAVCQQRLGRLAAARAGYERALVLRPDYGAAWNNLGALHHAQGEYDQAVDCYRKALAQEERAIVFKNLGTAHMAADRLELAMDAYRKAFAIDPEVFRGGGEVGVPGGHLATQFYLFAKLAAEAGRVDEAFYFLEQARSNGFHDAASVEADPAFEVLIHDARFGPLFGSPM
jgi:tetratricopeptide (TPR) repeat protein